MNRRRGAALVRTGDRAGKPPPDESETYRVERKTPRLAYGVVHAHVIYDSRLSFPARTLYAILCAHATTGDRTAWPGTARLAELMGCSDRTRWAAQQELIEHGYLKVTRLVDRGLKRGNLYTLTDDLPPDGFPHPRSPRSAADDGSQRSAADHGSRSPRSAADDGSQRSAADHGSGQPASSRSAADNGFDPQSVAGRNDPQQTTGHEQTSKGTRARPGVSPPGEHPMPPDFRDRRTGS